MPRRLPPQGPLQITGTPTIGSILTATRKPGLPVYHWQNGVDPNWSDIANASGLTYTEQASDSGLYLRIAETVAGITRYSPFVGPLSGPRRGRVTDVWIEAPLPTGGTAAPRRGLVTAAWLNTP